MPVTPGLPATGEAEAFLRDAGFAPGYGWMKFVRDTHPPRFSPPADVEVVELDGPTRSPSRRSSPPVSACPPGLRAFRRAARPAGWRCYVARVDGEAQATAAMLLDAGIAELGMAATLEPARRRGCQPALLHRRIVDAAAAGCELLFVETGERVRPPLEQLPQHPPGRLRGGLPLPQLGGADPETPLSGVFPCVPSHDGASVTALTNGCSLLREACIQASFPIPRS